MAAKSSGIPGIYFLHLVENKSVGKAGISRSDIPDLLEQRHLQQ